MKKKSTTQSSVDKKNHRLSRVEKTCANKKKTHCEFQATIASRTRSKTILNITVNETMQNNENKKINCSIGCFNTIENKIK